MKFMMKNGRPIRVQTRPVTDCTNCGACCRHMGTPPGYAAYYAVGGEIADWAKESPDYARWLALPAAVEADLRAYYVAVLAGTLADRTANYVDGEMVLADLKAGRITAAMAEIMKNNPKSDIPCLWYDAATHQCRHYEHRPETCRDAIHPGDEGCLATRKAFRIPLPTVAA